MITNTVLKRNNVLLRAVTIDDCNETYLNWLNETTINQYLETRWTTQSIESIKDFVKSIRESDHSYLFAIIVDGKHIGNIKIGPIHHHYQYADISYFIGEKSYWGKGIATDAIFLITDFGFKILKLNRIQAGAFADNIGSLKALEKNGYKKEAVLRKQIFVNVGDQFQDHIIYGILKDEW